MPWINVLQQSIVNKRFFFAIYLKNVLKTVFYYTCFKYILMMPWYLICSHIKSRELKGGGRGLVPPPQKKTQLYLGNQYVIICQTKCLIM